MPTDELWERYMSVEGQRTDLRLVPATIDWIRSELAAAARREDRPGTARLLRLDVKGLLDPAAALPSLAAFVEEAGLHDEREADQIAAYQQHYGQPTARGRRRARLLQRQLAALQWLEEKAARDPAALDAIASWLRPELARFLGAADLFTLAQLADRINGLGLNWARSIRGIGALKAARIASWLARQEATTGLVIGAHTTQPRQQVPRALLAKLVAASTDIRPIEKFLVPSELDGRRGHFRRPQEHCLMAAQTDYEAVLAWLRAKHQEPARNSASDEGTHSAHLPPHLSWMASLSHTQRSYRKEAERFLLWAIVTKRKPLSSMTAEDCMEYVAFLANPQPLARWCASRARPRWSLLWRPFEGPLAASARRQAITILKSMYGFWVDQNYLMGNPWSAVAMPRPVRSGLDISRSLTQAQWSFVRGQAAQGDDPASTRLRWTLDLMYATGLRAAEAVAATVDDIRAVDYFDAQTHEHVRGWMLVVIGKGQRVREVPMPQGLIDELKLYLQSRGLGTDLDSLAARKARLVGALPQGSRDFAKSLARQPSPDKSGMHAAAHKEQRDGLTEGALYRVLKKHFEACSRALAERGDEVAAARLLKASTHWLRHTHATHALASGVTVQEAQQNLGHASLATTTAYVTTEAARRLKSIQRFWEGRNL